MIDQRTRVAFALWNQSNPPALRAQCTPEKLGVDTTKFDDGTTIERDLGLDWELNRDSYLNLADAALAALALPLERAQALNKAMFNLALEREGLAKCPLDQLTLLRGASLLELTQAGPIVRAHDQAKAPSADGTRTFSMVCDDRLVAAVYTFLHFTLPPASSPHDEDYVVLSLTDTTHTYFLISGARERQDDDEEGEEE